MGTSRLPAAWSRHRRLSEVPNPELTASDAAALECANG